MQQQRTAQLELIDPNEIPLGVTADARHQPRDPRGFAPRGAPAAIPGIVAPPVDPRMAKTAASKTQTAVRAQARTDARIQHGKASAVAVGRGRSTVVRGGVKKVTKKKTTVVAARRKK